VTGIGSAGAAVAKAIAKKAATRKLLRSIQYLVQTISLTKWQLCGKWPATRMGVSHPPPQAQTSRRRLLPRVCEHLLGEDDGSVMHIVLGYGSSEAVQASRSHAQ
jgi:hypothetical protein